MSLQLFSSSSGPHVVVILCPACGSGRPASMVTVTEGVDVLTEGCGGQRGVDVLTEGVDYIVPIKRASVVEEKKRYYSPMSGETKLGI